MHLITFSRSNINEQTFNQSKIQWELTRNLFYPYKNNLSISNVAGERTWSPVSAMVHSALEFNKLHSLSRVAFHARVALAAAAVLCWPFSFLLQFSNFAIRGHSCVASLNGHVQGDDGAKGRHSISMRAAFRLWFVDRKCTVSGMVVECFIDPVVERGCSVYFVN